jgi:hypothetical protein
MKTGMKPLWERLYAIRTFKTVSANLTNTAELAQDLEEAKETIPGLLEYEAKRQLELERAAYARKHRHSLRYLDNGDYNEPWGGSEDGMTIEDYLGHYPGDA